MTLVLGNSGEEQGRAIAGLWKGDSQGENSQTPCDHERGRFPSSGPYSALLIGHTLSKVRTAGTRAPGSSPAWELEGSLSVLPSLSLHSTQYTVRARTRQDPLDTGQGTHTHTPARPWT